MKRLLQFLFFASVGYFLTNFLVGQANSKEVIETNIDFEDPKEATRWKIVNDGVMGGLSQSKVSVSKDKVLIFEGNVSLENYGGFASTRSRRPNLKVSNAQKVRLKVRGDGKIYQFRFRTNNNYDGIAYKNDFETTKDQWVEIELPFEDFVATYRGNTLDNEPKLIPSDIQQIGFLIANKQKGYFKLEVDWIRFYI